MTKGTPVRRPRGQVLSKATDAPVTQPCAAVDFELEMVRFGIWV